ncbi:TPA: hypothetical protein U2K59_002877 [Acinetobacter baumannii]|nr:hypothetical protein [Acinetobacter baumannii]
MPLITVSLIGLLILLPMSFFYFVVSTKQDVIDIGLFFLLAGLKGVLYPFIFHKLNLKTPLILLLGAISSIFVFFISNFMKGDSSGFIQAGAVALMYLAVFIPCYLISTFLQVVVLKNSKQ